MQQLEMFPASCDLAHRYGEDWATRTVDESRDAVFGRCAVSIRLRRTPDGQWWHSWSAERGWLRVAEGEGPAMCGPYDTRDIAVGGLATAVLERVARRDQETLPDAVAWMVDFRNHSVSA